MKRNRHLVNENVTKLKKIKTFGETPGLIMSKYIAIVSSTSESSDEEPIITTKRSGKRLGNLKLLQSLPSEEVPSKTFNIYTSEVDKFRVNKEKFRPAETTEIMSDSPEEVTEVTEVISVPTKSTRQVKEHKTPTRRVLERKAKEANSVETIPEQQSEVSPIPTRPKRNCRTNSAQKLIKNIESASYAFYNGLEKPNFESLDSPNLKNEDSSAESSVNNRNIVVKVRCRGAIERLPLRINDKFEVLLKKLAILFDVQEDKIILTLENNSISTTDTPASINLVFADIIDCTVSNDTVVNSANIAASNPNQISLILQSKNDRKKITLPCLKDEPLRIVMEQYAKEKGLNVASLTFKFDGDSIDPNDTPDDLDMDDSDCIDVIIGS